MTNQGRVPHSSHASSKVVLVVVVMASFLNPFMGSSINIAIPSIGRDLAMDAVALAWIATSYLLAASVFILPFGRFADIHGRKKTFAWGVLIHTVSSLFAAMSTGAAMLIVFRVIQGIAHAMIAGTGIAILSSVFPAEKRGRALGINVAAVYCGLSLGPFLGGVLTHHFGWRSIFLASVPMGVAIGIAVVWKLREEWTEARGERFDLAGSLVYGIGLVAFMYGLSLLPALSGVGVLLFGVGGLVLFVWWETRLAHPLINVMAFSRNRGFAFSNLTALISYSATFAIVFLLSMYLQYTKDYSPQQAGFFLVSMPAVQAVLSPAAGRLSDRIAPQIVASAGMALTTLGLALLSSLRENTSIWFILLSLIILGFGLAFFSSPNVNAVMRSVDRRDYGVASAAISTMRQVGMMFSMVISTLIFALHIGRVEITPEYYRVFVESVRIAFAVFAVLCFGGIFASLARGKIR